jgi:cytochrome P450
VEVAPLRAANGGRMATPTAPADRCPVAHGASERKTARGADPDAPALEERDGTWHVRSYAAVRQVLRDADATRQAGFNAEMATRTGLRPPVLFEDGVAHRDHRTAIARFFTPKTVDDAYQALMEEASDALIADLERRGRADLSDLSLDLAMQVAARVVGLTDSRAPGMAQRLEKILALERLERLPALRRVASMLRVNLHVLRFFLQDVRPAIRARRKAPREDVISHLIGKGYTNGEILIECITYGAAGMATTREFIVMAAWHLLEHDELRRRYLAADEPERHRMLHEVLRLEPVVGHLHRRATADVHLDVDGVATTIPAGALIDLDVRAANADADAVGAEPLCLRPDRERATRVQEPVLSFGDGAHRCPGAFIAIKESDAFLTRLLRLPLTVVGEPRLGWNDLIEGYEVRGLEVAVGATAAA